MHYTTNPPIFPVELDTHLAPNNPPIAVNAAKPFQFTQNGSPILPMQAGAQEDEEDLDDAMACSFVMNF